MTKKSFIQKQQAFAFFNKSRLNPHCQDCPFLNLCMGDCQKYRVNNGAQTPGISHLCAGWRHFFNHTKEPFEALENMLRNNKITGRVDYQHSLAAKKLPTVGRNQPCPCGSGRKYKKCCGAYGVV